MKPTAALAVPRLVRIVGASLAATACAAAGDDARSRHAEVVELLRAQRPFVLRLTGGFAHAPCGGLLAGPAEAGESLAPALATVRCAGDVVPEAGAVGRLTRIGAELRRALESGAGVDARWAAATLDLVLGDERTSVDRALLTLHGAERIAPPDASLLNDIAVALAARAQRDGAPLDLVRALDYAERAVTLDSAHAEASFNRAVLRQALFLVDVAIDAWTGYLELDGGSAWAREAGERLAAAQAVGRRHEAQPLAPRSLDGAEAEDVIALARESPRDLREAALDVLLAEWGSQRLVGHAESARARLERARAAGRALVEANGDSAVFAAVLAIDAAPARVVDALAHGHAAYGRARAAYRAGAFEQAENAFGEADRVLGATPTPFRDWPRLHLAALAMYRGEFDEAAHVAAAIYDSVAPSQRALKALASWVSGLNVARQGRWEAALPHYRAAERLFHRIGETGNRGSARMLQMEALLLLGEESAGMRMAHAALRDLQHDRASTSLHNLLRVIGDHAARRGLRHAERAVRLEDARTAARTGRPIDGVEAASLLASALTGLGDHTGAGRELERARNGLARVTDPGLHERLGIELAEAEAASLAPRDPAGAADRLADVILYFERQRIAGRHATALARRSAAHARANDAQRAEADLEAALAVVQTQSSAMTDASLRASLLESTSAAFDALIRLQVDRGQPLLALETLERSRAAFTPAGVAAAAPAVAPNDRASRAATRLEGLRARMDATQALLGYAVLDDRLLMWGVSRDTVVFRSRPIAASELSAAVGRLVEFIRHTPDPARLHVEGRALSHWLLEPFARVLSHARELVVIPDRALHTLPFAALPMPGEDALVIERLTLRSLPGIDHFAGVTAPPARPMKDVLLVGAPEVDRATFEDLPPLRAAEREMDSLAMLYPGAAVLRGPHATRRAVLTALQSRELLHFAGHARFRPDAPEQSHLVLAHEGALHSSLLVPADLNALDLRRLRLVVLSACSSLGASHSRLAGFDGLANAFLSAGAGGVIGTLWEVEDERTADLVIDVHRRLAQGERPADALRAAQLAALARGAADWSAFRYEGR